MGARPRRPAAGFVGRGRRPPPRRAGRRASACGRLPPPPSRRWRRVGRRRRHAARPEADGVLVGVPERVARALLDLAVRERRGRGLARAVAQLGVVERAESGVDERVLDGVSDVVAVQEALRERRGRLLRRVPPYQVRADDRDRLLGRGRLQRRRYQRPELRPRRLVVAQIARRRRSSWPRTAWRVASRPTVHTTRSKNASRVEGRRTTSAASVAAASPTAGSCRSSCAR